MKIFLKVSATSPVICAIIDDNDNIVHQFTFFLKDMPKELKNIRSMYSNIDTIFVSGSKLLFENCKTKIKQFYSANAEIIYLER